MKALNGKAPAKAETNFAVTPTHEMVTDSEQSSNEEAPSSKDEYTLG